MAKGKQRQRAAGFIPAVVAKDGGDKPRRSPMLLVLCALALLPAMAAAQTTAVYGDIKVTVDPEQRGLSNHGYTAYGLRVDNDSPRPRRVTIALSGASGGRRYGDHIRSIRRTVEVGARSSVRVVLYQPADPPLANDSATLTIDGSKQDRSLPLRPIQQNFASNRTTIVLASAGLDVNMLRVVGGPGGGPEFGPGGGWINREIVGPDWGATPWPENWLGYSRYDGVVVTPEALKALKAEARTALFQYVECGGSLAVLGQAEVADGWKPDFKGNRYTLYHPGFGQCIVTEDRAPFWNQQVWGDIVRSWLDTSNTWSTNDNPLAANQRFPVIENLGIPARGLFLLMLGFAIVLGPVNLSLLTRWKRRIWMLWTVPVISAATCAAVFGYMVVAEGWSGHLRTEAITVLDQNTQRASTLGWTAFYTPLTPGDGLRFSQDTELTCQLGGNSRDPYRRRGGKSCEIDWSDGQRLTRGWVSARVPAHFRLRKSEPRRERVTVRRGKDGNLSAVNGLGAAIKKLTVADERGQLYTAGPIGAGADARLQATGRSLSQIRALPLVDPQAQPFPNAPVPEGRVSLREVFRGEWLNHAKAMRTTPEKYLAPLRYLADVEGGPFVEDGLPRAGQARRSAVVLGILKEIEP